MWLGKFLYIPWKWKHVLLNTMGWLLTKLLDRGSVTLIVSNPNYVLYATRLLHLNCQTIKAVYFSIVLKCKAMSYRLRHVVTNQSIFIPTVYTIGKRDCSNSSPQSLLLLNDIVKTRHQFYPSAIQFNIHGTSTSIPSFDYWSMLVVEGLGLA